MKKIFIFILICICNKSLSAQSFNFVNKIISSDRDSLDGFGGGVSISGGYAVVGDAGDKDDSLGGNTQPGKGSAYIYKEDQQQYWHFFQKITPFDRDTVGSLFGTSVSISGNYIVVGAPDESKDSVGLNNVGYAGAAYIYKLIGSHWNFVQKITAWDRQYDDGFGNGVSISGNRILVSAAKQDYDAQGNNYLNSAGAAYIFEPDINGHWLQKQKIIATQRRANQRFGSFNAVSIYGSRIMLGAASESYDTTEGNFLNGAGAAYIFEYDSISGQWNNGQKIVAGDRTAGDLFGGLSTAIEVDWAVTGAIFNKTDSAGLNPIFSSGSAYIFRRDTNGIWTQWQKLSVHNRFSGDFLGNAVSISGDNILLGAREHSDTIAGSNPGAAYVFRRDENTNHWSEVQQINSTDPDPLDEFGGAVCISNNTIIVGAGNDSQDTLGANYMHRSGSAYIYKLNFTSSINDIASQNENLFVFPNPTTGTFTFTTNKIIAKGVMQLYNVLGEKVYEENIFNTNSKAIAIKNLSPGIYFITLTDEQNKNQLRAKLVVE